MECSQICSRQGRRAEALMLLVLEEQVNQMLKEWKNELNEPSPASSLQQGASVGPYSPDISRLLQLCDEEDDATNNGLQGFTVNHTSQEQSFQLLDQCKGSPSGVNNTDITNQLDYFSFDLPHDFEQNFFTGIDGMGLCTRGEDTSSPQITTFLPTLSPPPSAFLGPKCALWDCPRPAQGWCSDRPVQGWFPDYCSSLHAAIAQNEGRFGMTPVIRPKGIELKDTLLLLPLVQKHKGKMLEFLNVKELPLQSPHGMPLSCLIFRGKQYVSGCSLISQEGHLRVETENKDHSLITTGVVGYESRKQVINESGWLKRSYYMDPQPMKFLEWHLYEYEISKCDVCALYRLELKLVDGKKSPKGKIANDSLADLQKQMGRLTAEFPLDNSYNNKRKGKGNLKDKSGGATVYPMVASDDGAPFNYLVDDVGGF
uniref:Uncharacterized protein n=1 Tax=Lactuca sativa TaxID=4236 RepID=A0A9R1VVX8_LACSA|nr:hypothetical protein LSAT_V11C400177230 [Lactuca sativa]